jgi:hypothetical protein
MLGFRKIRYANISPDKRETFERYGETVIQLMVTSGFNPRPEELIAIYQDKHAVADATKWLTERADKNANHEWRVEIVEWAILIFVVLGVSFDLILVLQGGN